MSQMSEKIAVVTGGTQGLGAAIATLFAERGCAGIVICGRSKDRGEMTAQEIQAASGVTTIFVAADLANVEDCRAVIAKTDEKFGRVDVLVNAAAITDRGNIIDTTPELFDRIIATNLRGPFFLMQETIKVMRRESIEGAIVNICSMSARAGQPFLAAYCSSKGALATLTQNTAFALLRNHIRVNGLNIGWMASDGEDRVQREYHGAGPEWLAQAAKHLPFGRLISTSEVARAVAFLSSAESGLMTGSIINFDQSIWGAYEDTPYPRAVM